jgi:hypothetical protein
MLDSDLAELYKVPTFRLNEESSANRERFPEDFRFQLTAEEAQVLTSQIAMSKPEGRGGRRTLPYVFTQEGVAMLCLCSTANASFKVNVAIMRAFVPRLRVVPTPTRSQNG